MYRPGSQADKSNGASELATVLVVRKKDDHNKKTSHLLLEMSMNEAFISLSGHRIIGREIFNGYNFFPNFH